MKLQEAALGKQFHGHSIILDIFLSGHEPLDILSDYVGFDIYFVTGLLIVQSGMLDCMGYDIHRKHVIGNAVYRETDPLNRNGAFLDDIAGESARKAETEYVIRRYLPTLRYGSNTINMAADDVTSETVTEAQGTFQVNGWRALSG
jgi:hypothetical protein